MKPISEDNRHANFDIPQQGGIKYFRSTEIISAPTMQILIPPPGIGGDL